MERKMGLFSFLAFSKASGPHAYQSTGLCACCNRYGLFSCMSLLWFFLISLFADLCFMFFTSEFEDRDLRFPVNNVIKIIKGNSVDNVLFICIAFLYIKQHSRQPVVWLDLINFGILESSNWRKISQSFNS